MLLTLVIASGLGLQSVLVQRELEKSDLGVN